MIDKSALLQYFPAYLRDLNELQPYLLKEYIQCQILEFLSQTKYIEHMVFIGGTNLRLIKQIDRFSEYLDFDCVDMTQTEFMHMTDSILVYLRRLGYQVIPKEKEHEGLQAFRRSLYFPELLYTLQFSGYRNARFLIKIEAQDQGYTYPVTSAFIQSCGFFFPVPVPPDATLCSMKLSALLQRAKGRDFYDAQFLLSQTAPDYAYLTSKHNIENLAMLKEALKERISRVDLKVKQRDFEHLLFQKEKSNMILNFPAFIEHYTHSGG